MSNLKGIRKTFNADIHAATDKPAKQRAMDLLKDSEFTILENPKKRKVDLLVYRDGKHVASIEVETKFAWTTPNFPFSSIQFPERKKSIAIDKVPVIFCMFSKDYSNYLTVTGDVLISSDLVEVPNRYIHRGEYFYQVPKTKATFNDLLNVLRKAT